jgi:hypothetical protein
MIPGSEILAWLGVTALLAKGCQKTHSKWREWRKSKQASKKFASDMASARLRAGIPAPKRENWVTRWRS